MTVQTDFLERCKALNLHDGKLSDWLDEIESLRQQLAAAQDKQWELIAEKSPALVEARQQLSAALAVCKLKDAAIKDLLEFATYSTCGKAHAVEAAKEALAIQPDDSALKAWLGEPIGEVKKHTGSLKDMAIIVWSGEQPAEGTKLYSPKGLK